LFLKNRDQIEEIPGIPYRFRQTELLEQALSHRSLGQHNNERLEFLGDSVLNFVVTTRLFELRPDIDEGGLSRLRSRVVRGDTLAQTAARLQLGEFIKLGEGELKSGGFKRNSILADALEAVFGAIYLDGGIGPCVDVIRHLFDPIIVALPGAEELKDPKTRLQEKLQGDGMPLPEYVVEEESGPPHKKRFVVRCSSPAAGFSVSGTGRSRRKAEQDAARLAIELLAQNSEV
jgi:ribonuclease-3